MTRKMTVASFGIIGFLIWAQVSKNNANEEPVPPASNTQAVVAYTSLAKREMTEFLLAPGLLVQQQLRGTEFPVYPFSIQESSSPADTLSSSPSNEGVEGGVVFEAAIQQYDPFLKKRSLQWIRYYVTEQEYRFQIQWHEPHWLTARFPSYPVALRAAFRGDRATLGNPIHGGNAIYVNSLARPSATNRFTYDFADIRFSHREMRESISLMKKSSKVKDMPDSNQLFMRLSGEAPVQAEYRYNESRAVEVLNVKIDERPLKLELDPPRMVARVVTVNGEQNATVVAVPTETVNHLPYGREVKVDFDPMLGRELPSEITVRNKETGSLLQRAKFSGYADASDLPTIDDFVAESSYLNWVRFAVATNIKGRALAPSEIKYAKEHISRVSKRIQNAKSLPQKLRLVRTWLITLLRLQATAEEFHVPLEIYCQSLLDSGFPFQVFWSGVDLQELFVFKDRKDVLEVVRRSLCSAVQKLIERSSSEEFVQQCLNLVTECRLGEEWYSLALLKDIDVTGFSPEQKSLLSAFRIALLKRGGDSSHPAAFYNSTETASAKAKLLAEIKMISASLSAKEANRIKNTIQRIGSKSE